MRDLRKEAERRKELRVWYKENHICPRCHRPLTNEKTIMCKYCLAVDRDRPRNGGNREQHAQRNKERKNRLKQDGMCIECGKRKAESGRVMCKWCNERNNARQREASRKAGKLPRFMFGDGEHCAICGKLTENGKKLCAACYAKMPRYYGGGEKWRKTNGRYFKHC